MRYGVVLSCLWGLAGCGTPAPVRLCGARSEPRLTPSILEPEVVDVTGGKKPVCSTERCYSIPGPGANSRQAWELFLDDAAHRVIAFIYKADHPDIQVFSNTTSLSTLLARTAMGNTPRLLSSEREMRPDIVDVTHRELFEIKPSSEQGLLDGKKLARTYLNALNRSAPRGGRFQRGKDFQGDVLIRFTGVQHIWLLAWRIHEPGVIQYEWTRHQEWYRAPVTEDEAEQWKPLTELELQ